MSRHTQLNSTSICYSLILLFILQLLQSNGHPYPHPHPHPVVQQTNSQTNEYGLNFDKTQFKPPELEETIEEVQKILQSDPTLPRLTRGEIEELYEKVTREEYQKSVEAGDMGRADSMRALMLVLPYNTDNSTTDNLQELYTRPPVTKVIDSYTQPQPIKFITPSSVTRTDTVPSGDLAATTYKPVYPLNHVLNPTTYHPPPPAPLIYKLTPAVPEPIYDFQPITNQPPATQYNPQTLKSAQRFSSHYNAKNAEFLKLTANKNRKTTSTVKPVADVLESLGIVGQAQSRNRFTIDDYYPAESAPKPVISSYVPLTGSDLDLGLRGQNIAPKIKPDAYTSFKPLNIGEEIRIQPEVEDYLTRFGIVGGRKRKALKKTNTKAEHEEEQTGAGSELSAASLPNGTSKSKKTTAGTANSELEKLLENLQELERLNANRKTTVSISTTPPPTRSPPTTTTTTKTTTTTTTQSPIEPTTASLITNGIPTLIEPKKPRRRIDPHIDINFGATGNQQSLQTNDDQLSKLLENLQELEKLHLNPENVLKTVAPSIKAGRIATKPIQTTTTPIPVRIIETKDLSPQSEQLELQRLLRELQAFDQSNAKTTTKKPIVPNLNSAAPLDLLQLRKLLTDDSELERLYEQARRRVVPSSTTTTTTTTTTARPVDNDFELKQLQRYLAELDKTRTSTTSTTTTTTTTTPRPTTTTKPIKKPIADDSQIQELISRVQQLERLNDKPKVTTESSLPYLGFTSRNVKLPTATASDYRVPSNDFAQLQQLYKQVQEADRAAFPHVEISTAATAPKYSQSTKRTQQFTKHLIDITNDTGSGSSLQEVDPNDFVQLQKLLSKVQELERVKISKNDAVDTTTPVPKFKLQSKVTSQPHLVTAASIQSHKVQHPNNAEIIYPENPSKHNYIEFVDEFDDLKLDLPAYAASTTEASTVSKKSEAILFPQTISSEELHELAYSKPINPNQSVRDKEFEQYQEFFTSLEDGGERNKYRSAYDNMEPPMIQKTVTKEPPRFVATKKPLETSKSKPLTHQQQSDLAELQKLLNNAQELGKLGVTLPKSLAEQIESKLSKNNELATSTVPTIKSTKTSPKVTETNVYLDRYGLKPKTTTVAPDSSEKAAVFSLTTPKPSLPKPFTPSTDNPMELPVFSATKIIEAAIKRAANRIGVSTEQPQGFRRRSDTDADDLELEGSNDDSDDMLGEFSEMSYQIAIPEINRMDELTTEKTEPISSDNRNSSADISQDLGELQRLIGNLQELQKLNISISSDMLRMADTKYLESFKSQLTTGDDTSKSRRQSVTPSVSTVASNNTATESTSSTTSEPSSTTTSPVESTPTAPTRVNLDLGLDDTGTAASETINSSPSSSSSSSSSSTSTTTEGTTTTEESRNGSLADLEDSFGPDPNKEEPLPPKKKNGFYFLADWNSFLEVGDGDDQVVVRFSPKIGDPRLFLPVKIP